MTPIYYVKCPLFSTRGGEGVIIGQILVHVVVECPLSAIKPLMYLGSRGHFPTFWRANLLFSNLSRYLIGYIVN